MRCEVCERLAEFIVESDEVHVACGRHANSFYGRTIPIGDYAKVRSALDEAERIIGSVLGGKIAKAIHPKHPEVHWVLCDAGTIFSRAVNSSDGKVFPVVVERNLQESYERIARSILNGWKWFVLEERKSEGWRNALVESMTEAAKGAGDSSATSVATKILEAAKVPYIRRDRVVWWDHFAIVKVSGDDETEAKIVVKTEKFLDIRVYAQGSEFVAIVASLDDEVLDEIVDFLSRNVYWELARITIDDVIDETDDATAELASS